MSNPLSDIFDVRSLIVVALGGLCALAIGCFLWGCWSVVRKYFRMLLSEGPMTREDAHMAYGLSLLLWRGSLVCVAAVLLLWFEWGILEAPWAVLLSAALFLVGWQVRELGRKRMKNSLARGGYGVTDA